jgi:hypothetical protein
MLKRKIENKVIVRFKSPVLPDGFIPINGEDQAITYRGPYVFVNVVGQYLYNDRAAVVAVLEDGVWRLWKDHSEWRDMEILPETCQMDGATLYGVVDNTIPLEGAFNHLEENWVYMDEHSAREACTDGERIVAAEAVLFNLRRHPVGDRALWKNKTALFSRMLLELMANVPDRDKERTLKEIAERLDLNLTQVKETLMRASQEWDKAGPEDILLHKSDVPALYDKAFLPTKRGLVFEGQVLKFTLSYRDEPKVKNYYLYTNNMSLGALRPGASVIALTPDKQHDYFGHFTEVAEEPLSCLSTTHLRQRLLEYAHFMMGAMLSKLVKTGATRLAEQDLQCLQNRWGHQHLLEELIEKHHPINAK